MTRIENILEHSRTHDVLGKIERGERLDLEKTLTLQALDMVRSNETFVLDTLEAERQADDHSVERFA